MSATTEMVRECMCVVLSYDTTFSHLCHAVHMPLCASLLSLHARVVNLCVLKEVITQTRHSQNEFCACAWGIILHNTYRLLIKSLTLQQVSYSDKNELGGMTILTIGKDARCVRKG